MIHRKRMGHVKQVTALTFSSMIEHNLFNKGSCPLGTPSNSWDWYPYRKGSIWISRDGESSSLEEFIFKLGEFMEEKSLESLSTQKLLPPQKSPPWTAHGGSSEVCWRAAPFYAHTVLTLLSDQLRQCAAAGRLLSTRHLCPDPGQLLSCSWAINVCF